ncbi:hypothetical protein JAAARDRAFT_130109 [Jaapia argillacea MUCL 33604]|uniref:Lysophospholipase n=1 Tax=Jaapia argillacea MUCL 33604 TaxID=933084 RepID=A0A067PRW1_9AGAM|nr:hypothetical protein JAAARDRAFT_130109 [Jaapia argillacea MUCL 33604]
MASHGYAPRTDVPCPATPLARLPRYDFPWGLNTQEASYINNRSSKIIPQAWNEWVGDGSGIGYNIASFRDVLPTVGIALGGVGYRGALYDAGVLSALDARNSSAVAAGTGGLLQVSSYISSTSGGAWLTGSLLFNNWPTITDLVYGNGRDTNGWMLDVPITVPDGFNVFSAKNQIFYDRLLKVAGSKNFYSSLTDVWGLMVGYHFLNQSGRETFFSADLEFGAGQLWSDIPSIPVYQQYQVPYPIVVANSPDLLTFEITPHEFGSWDLNISSLTNLEYSGTTPRLKQSDCVTGLDQASFILGTSSNFFNQYLDVRRNMMKGFSQVDASGLLYISSRFDRNTSEGATDAANWPNPFYMTVPATRWSGTSLPTLGLVDGTSNLESIPMGQLLLSSRNLDVIIAADASSDDPIHQWPNGTSVFYTAQRVSKSSSSVYHKGFPPIPANQGEFVSMGLNLRPTFFGCSLDGSKPPSHVLIIYLPNSPPLNGDDPVTNTDIFKASYSLGHAHLFLDQVHSNAISGFTPNSTSSDQYFGKCLQCALIDSARFKTASIVPRSDICSKCFLQYCYDPANPPSKSWVLDRKLTYVDPDGPSPSLSRRDVMIATPSAVGFALAIGLGFLFVAPLLAIRACTMLIFLALDCTDIEIGRFLWRMLRMPSTWVSYHPTSINMTRSCHRLRMEIHTLSMKPPCCPHPNHCLDSLLKPCLTRVRRCSYRNTKNPIPFMSMTLGDLGGY